MKTYDINLGGGYTRATIVAKNFEEALSKTKKLQAKYKKEDPTASPRQMAICAIIEKDDITPA